MRIDDSRRPLPDQKTSVLFGDKGYKTAGRGGLAFAEVGQLIDAIFPEGNTKLFNRANPALRISWRTNQRAEFHQRLVQKGTSIRFARRPRRILFLRILRGLRATNQFFGDLPKPGICFLLLRVFRDAKNPGQYADDIAVENGRWLVEGDAANRAGGITANARQREDIVKVLREFSPMLFHN